MGRGKNKAKQAKIARDMKYSSIELDIKSLTDDLHAEKKKKYKNPAHKKPFHKPDINPET